MLPCHPLVIDFHASPDAVASGGSVLNYAFEAGEETLALILDAGGRHLRAEETLFAKRWGAHKGETSGCLSKLKIHLLFLLL